ncbi:MAG: sodium:solute symporter [Rhodothermaceae bacterium]|nr:sodium:solute symporter [Rhodothermaceae bacterium]
MELINTLDWVLIAIYFVAVFGVAFGVGRKEKSTDSSAGYFLAGRNTGWFVIGASLFASNIGAEHIIGLAGTGASSGVAVGQFEILASFMLLILGWVFVPFYLKSGVFTMPEFLERRYNEGARWYLAIISIVGYILTKISITIAAGGIVFNTLMGINFWTGALIVIIATGVYTVFGGLRAVLYTDLLQMFILIGGAITVTFIGLSEVGGWGVLRESVDSSFFSVWKPMSDPDFPWTGIIFGAPILGVWYWCTDQFIVQRVLSASNIDNARRGTIFGGLLKQLPLFIFVVPGIIALVLSQSGQISLSEPDAALPTLIGTLLPAGVRGLVVAGLLAALMSSLSSVFNSCSTLIAWDIYKKIKPNSPDKTLVLVGQVSTVGMVILGLLWIPFMDLISGQLFVYLQNVQAYIAPPIAAVFLIGVFWKRVNSNGAIASLITGFVLGIGRLIADLNKDSLSGLLFEFTDINFLHYAFYLFVICTLVLIVVSLATDEPDEAKVKDLTFQTVDPSTNLPSDPLWRQKDVWAAFALIVIVLGVWVYFTG